MNKPVYIIEYYVDYETHGVETILSTEEEAIKYIQKYKCELPDSDYHLLITQKILFKNHEEAYTERHDYEEVVE